MSTIAWGISFNPENYSLEVKLKKLTDFSESVLDNLPIVQGMLADFDRP